MTEDQKHRLKKLAKFFAFKVPIIIAVLIVMMIVSLKLVERYPDPLRQGFEDYLSRTYNSTATIGQLEEVKFFPNIHIRARDITMHNKSNAAVIDIAVGFIDIKAPFTSMIFGTGKIKNLDVRDLKSAPNFILPQNMQIDNLSIMNKEGPDQYGAFLIAEGRYASDKMAFEAEIQKDNALYVIGDNIPFSITRGQATINAQIVKQSAHIVVLKNAVYAVGGIQSQAKEYILLEDNVFQDDNPLSCLVMQDTINECAEYTKK